MTEENIAHAEVVRWLKRIDQKLDRVVYRDLYESEKKAMSEDIADMRANQTWSNRTLILALVGLVVNLALGILALSGGAA
jgi:hypothetical protein